MLAEPGSSKQIPEKETIDIEKILQKIAKSKTIIPRNYVNNNTKNNTNNNNDRIVSNDNPRNSKNLQSNARQPIVMKRNTEQLEKLKRYRNELHELSEIVDLEINRTEVEWLSLTYEADKLKTTDRTRIEPQIGTRKTVTIEEIDEQLRNRYELPVLDLRPTISNRTDDGDNIKEEEFDTDSSES